MTSPARVSGTDRNLPANGGIGTNQYPINHRLRSVRALRPEVNHAKNLVNSNRRKRKIRVITPAVAGPRQNQGRGPNLG